MKMGRVNVWVISSIAFILYLPTRGMDQKILASSYNSQEGVLRSAQLVGWSAQSAPVKMSVSDDGKKLVGALLNEGEVPIVCVWDVDTGKVLRLFRGHKKKKAITCVSFVSNDVVASGSRDKTIRLWDMNTGQQIEKFRGHLKSITSMRVTSQGHIISSSRDGAVRTWKVAHRKKKFNDKKIDKTKKHVFKETSVCLAPGGKKIVTWEGTRRALGFVPLDDSNDGIFGLLNKDSEVVLGSYSIKLFDIKSGKELVTCLGHSDAISSAVITDDENRIVSGCWDGSVCVWNCSTGEQRAKFSGHTAPINALAVASDCRRVASASSDGIICLWDSETGKEIIKYKSTAKPIFSISITSLNTIISIAENGTMHVWNCPRIGYASQNALLPEMPRTNDSAQEQPHAWIPANIQYYFGPEPKRDDGEAAVVDYQQARILLEKVAQQTDNIHSQATACSILGVMSCAGEGSETDYLKGRSYFEQAVLQNSNKEAQETALRNLEMLNEEFPISNSIKTMKERLNVFRGAAKAQWALENHSAGDMKPLTDAETLELLREGEAHFVGLDENAQAGVCFEKIVKQSRHIPSIIIAWLRLGDIYSNVNSAPDMAQNFPQACLYYKYAARQGRNPLIQATASHRLGAMYYVGLGIAKNIQKARKYHMQAAHQQYDLSAQADSCYILGEILYFDDPESALAYLERAAEQSLHLEARYKAALKLGGLYALGHGSIIKKDQAKAYEYYQIVANQHLLPQLQQTARERLSMLSKFFQRAEKDEPQLIDQPLTLIIHADKLYEEKRYREALGKYEEAAKQKLNREARAIAFATLGTIYFEGLLGVEKDITKAGELYEKAAANFDKHVEQGERSSSLELLNGLSAHVIKSWGKNWQSQKNEELVDQLYPFFKKKIEVANKTGNDLYWAFYEVGLRDAHRLGEPKRIGGLEKMRIPFPRSKNGFDIQLFIATEDTYGQLFKELKADAMVTFLRKSFRRTNVFNWYACGGKFEIRPDVTHPSGLKVSSKSHSIKSSNVIEAIGLAMAKVPASKQIREKAKAELNTSMTEMKVSLERTPEVLDKNSLVKEQEYFHKRLSGVKMALNALLQKECVTDDDCIPNIALVFTGGGYRATCETIGFLRGAERNDQGNIFDCCMYMMGLSGSTWAIKPLVASGLRPAAFFNEQSEKMGFGIRALAKKLKKSENYQKRRVIQKEYGQEHGVTGFYGHMIGNTLLEFDKDNAQEKVDQHSITLSDLSAQLLPDPRKYPLPLSVAVDLDGHKHYRIWYEFSPFYVGTHQIGADASITGTWVESRYFGSIFRDGILRQAIPEYPLAHYMGIWGSAFSVNPCDVSKVNVRAGRAFSVVHGISANSKRIFNAVFQIRNSEKNLSGRLIPPARFPNYNYANEKFDVPHEYSSRRVISLVDGGILTQRMDTSIEEKPVRHNFATVPALHRKCDILILCDSNEDPYGDSISEHLVASSIEAEKLGLAFPKLTGSPHAEKLLNQVNADMKEKCYSLIIVEGAPIVIYMKCKAMKKPIERAESEIDLASFMEDDEIDPAKASFAKTTNFKYKQEEFIALAELAEKIFIESKLAIKKAIETAIERKAQLGAEQKKK